MSYLGSDHEAGAGAGASGNGARAAQLSVIERLPSPAATSLTGVVGQERPPGHALSIGASHKPMAPLLVEVINERTRDRLDEHEALLLDKIRPSTECPVGTVLVAPARRRSPWPATEPCWTRCARRAPILRSDRDRAAVTAHRRPGVVCCDLRQVVACHHRGRPALIWPVGLLLRSDRAGTRRSPDRAIQDLGQQHHHLPAGTI